MGQMGLVIYTYINKDEKIKKGRKDHPDKVWPYDLVLFLTGATWYYRAIYILLTYFVSFTVYEEDIFKGISNLHVQG